MGSLSDLRLPTSEVFFSEDQSITVRGLSVADLSEIIRDHATVLNSIYQENIVNAGEMPAADVLARALMTEAPEVVARIIAHANDEPESWEIVKNLPTITQINGLVEVAILTFHSEAEVKKLMETLIQGSTVLSSLLGIVGDRSLPET